MSPKLLLCCDMDRTLIPNGAQSESKAARQTFSAFVSHDNVVLAYVTGRDKTLVKNAMAYYKLPQADYVIADVGMSIYKVNSDSDWQFLHDWQISYKHDWLESTNSDIARLLKDVKVLRKQEVSKQKDYKLSYYLPLYINHQELIQKMHNILHAQNIYAELIWSMDEPRGIGLLDVMPKSATKKTAIEFLMHSLGFDVLVANAHHSIKEMIQPYIQQHSDNVYLAQGGFNNMNGNYSSGVMEGVYYYMPDIEQILGAGG